MTNLYALIVGIEKYDLPNCNRSGPVAGALQMASWCTSIGASTKNIFMFLTVDETEPSRVSQHTQSLSQFKQMGIKVNEDTSLNTIDTFWRKTLPTLPGRDSKLFVYWCGHGVTRADRDRILLHTDYNPVNLSSRATSAHNLFATLTTQAYGQLKEQLIIADVCGDFIKQPVSPNDHSITNPVNTIAQHCYFASVDGESAQIDNGIGQFTKSSLEVLTQYTQWPDLDDLKTRMDKKFRNGSSKAFKIWIRTPQEEYDEIGDKSDHAKDAIMQPSSEDVKQLLSNCIVRIKRNELDELFQLLEDFLATTKSTAFDQVRDSLLILQSDLTSFRTGEINGTLMPDTATHRRILITKVQNLLKFIESKASEQTKGSSNPKPTFKSHHDFFREQIYKLLDGNDELTAVFAQAIFSKNQTWDKNSVAEHLVGNSGSTNDFPLRRFKRVLAKLVDERIELKKDSFQTLTLLTEILEIASYPLEDSQRIEKAMQEILSSDIGNPAIGSLSTSKIEDAKKLLIATRLKLLGAEFSDLSVAQLFNKNMMDNTDVRLLMRKIHVVTEPTLKSEDLTLIEFYSKACIDDLNYTQSSSSYQDDLQDVLEEKSEDSAVVCLLLSNEKTEAIKQLRKRFPLLLVIGLPKESIGLYKAIVRDLKDIDECLPLLCGTVKRIT